MRNAFLLAARHRLWTTSILSLALPFFAFSATFGVQDFQRQQRQHLASARAAEFTAQVDFQGAKSQQEAYDITQRHLDIAWARIDELVATLDVANADKDSLSKQVSDLKGQISDLNEQIASTRTGGGTGGAVVAYSVGGTGNHFSYGYCTWYVASRVARYIPWFGDAGSWLNGARAFGWATGSLPRVGAIEVSWPAAPGHVGLVETVNADGTFLVAEMNYVAWNTVDKRLVAPAREPITGFIYP